MILLGIDDGTSAKRAIQLSADAVFTGLVVNMDGGVNLDNDGDGTFFIRGAVMSTGDVRFTNNGNVGYDPRALANLQITAADDHDHRGPGDVAGAARELILTPLSASGTGNREDHRGPGAVARTARGPVSVLPSPGLATQARPCANATVIAFVTVVVVAQ